MVFKSVVTRGLGYVPRRAFPAPMVRHFHTSFVLKNDSLFGQVTKGQEVDTADIKQENDIDPDSITPATDKPLQQYYLEEAKKSQITPEKYIAPIKRRLFELNVKKNGFFKNHQVVRDKETNEAYHLSLTPEEIDALEPSIYLQSYRLKSSMKKATVVNRFVRGFKVKNAINQLHFNPKKMSTELEKLLKRGLEQARQLNYNEDELYIQSLWVGSDGSWVKRVDAKGRGRTGIIKHPYVHIKAILRTEQTTLRRAWEKSQKEANAAPPMGLNNEPLNFKVRPYYKW